MRITPGEESGGGISRYRACDAAVGRDIGTLWAQGPVAASELAALG